MSKSTSTDESIPDMAPLQLGEFKMSQKVPERLTMSNGAPIANKTAALTVGPRGPMLMQDIVYLDEISHFDRERVPERVVHAKGGGAHGFFEVTHDITKYTKAAIFSEIGRKTPMFVRFSTVSGESGSPDTIRDPRGFAMKFYTEEGNWDLVANNTPIFFIRDPFLFPSFIHTQKRDPRTNLKDPNMMWDFFTLRPESLHQVMFLFGDRGTPDGFRHMNGYGSHTFKLINKDGEAVYCKFHAKTCQGIKNLSAEKSARLTGENPDYAIRDLFNAIESGHFPQWNFFIQVMTFEQAEQHRWNPFDLTKVWPHGEFPLIPVGRITLNRNVANYFTEVEQSAFAPAHLVPGIDFSPDKMLQGRIFSYPDTQFHRLGPNYKQLPINCPYRARVANYQRCGLANIGNDQGGAPIYHPNTFNGPVEPTNPKEKKHLQEHEWDLVGRVARHDSSNDANYDQPTIFWEKVLDDAAKIRLVENIVEAIRHVLPDIQKRVITEFSKVHEDMGKFIEIRLEEAKKNKHHL